MSLDRTQRRALEREQRKQTKRKDVDCPVLFAGTAPLWMALLVALPVVVVPLFVVYLQPGFLAEGSNGQFVLNEFHKYAAELVCLGLLLTGAGALLVGQNLWPRLPRQVLWPALLYLTAVAFSLLQAQDLERGLVNALQVSLLPLLFFLLVAGLRWSQSRVLVVLGLMLSAGAVVSLIGISQKLEVWEFALMLPHVGAGSLLFFQNLAGEYLILLIPPAVVLIFMPIHWLFRVGAALLSSVFLVHLAMTLARGAWVGLFGGVIISIVCVAWGIYRLKKGRADEVGSRSLLFLGLPKRALYISVVLLLVVLLGSGIWVGSGGKGSDSPYVKELLSISLSKTTGRIQIWTDSLALLEERWLLGVGPGHYRIGIPAFLEESPKIPYLFQWDEKTGRTKYPFRPHNDFMQNWIELGLFGLVGMVGLFVAVVWISTRGISEAVASGDRALALLILGCFGAFSAWVVSMLFEFPIRMPASMLLGWLCAGLSVSLSLRQGDVIWSPIRPVFNLLAGAIVLMVVVTSFYVGHIQFWTDICEKKAKAAWTSKDHAQSYAWQNKAYGYAPWKESTGVSKAWLEMILGKHQEALNTSREVVRRNPYLLPALFTQGSMARRLGYRAESQAAFGKIVETYPFLPENEKYRRFAGLPPMEKPQGQKPE